jgi:hypothetical protein
LAQPSSPQGWRRSTKSLNPAPLNAGAALPPPSIKKCAVAARVYRCAAGRVRLCPRDPTNAPTSASSPIHPFCQPKRRSRHRFDGSCRGRSADGVGDRKRSIVRSPVAVARRLASDAVNLSPKPAEILQQIYLNFLTCFASRHCVSANGPNNYIWRRAFLAR